MVRDGVVETPFLSNRLSVFPLDESRWSTCSESSRTLSLTKAARRLQRFRCMEPRVRVELTSTRYKPVTSPSMLARQILWSFAADLNCALGFTSAEHRHLCLRSMERNPGVQPG